MGATHCSGFSCCEAGALGTRASLVVAHGLSCSTACENLPGPGLQPVSPALAGGFSTTAPPGKPLWIRFLSCAERIKANQSHETGSAKDQHLEDHVDQFYRILLMKILQFQVFTLFLTIKRRC